MAIVLTNAPDFASAKDLIERGIDVIEIGEAPFAWNLPFSYTRDEQREIADLAHRGAAEICAVIDILMTPERMENLPEYLKFLVEIHADYLLVGDVGVIEMLREMEIEIPYIYAPTPLVTNSDQINFFAQDGAYAALISNEIPKNEMAALVAHTQVPVIINAFGAVNIQHSRRKLIRNYFDYKNLENNYDELFIVDPADEKTHYTIYEDAQGTHTFNTNDLDLMPKLGELYAMGAANENEIYERTKPWPECHRKMWIRLNSLFFKDGEKFVKIAGEFKEAWDEIAELTQVDLAEIDANIRANFPEGRTYSTVFYELDEETIK
ncbi:MAG: U32 family peptidase [Lactobacillales bacterium]|jgi:collagenase-like PrtC family protease|nr:U32 family peptidase [Lactobacillales bacterium]